MKTLKFAVILLVLPCLLFGEITRKVIFRVGSGFPRDVSFFSGDKEVAKESFDDAGKITRTGIIPDGLVKEYGDNKKLLSTWNYQLSKLNGKSELYFPTGELMAEVAYNNDLVESANIYTKEKEPLVKISGPSADNIEFNIKADTLIPLSWIFFSVESNNSSFLQGAELDAERKCSFITSSIGRIYGIKKEKIHELKTSASGGSFRNKNEMVSEKSVTGGLRQTMKNSFVVYKMFIITGLGGKKPEEIREMLGKIQSYGVKDVKEFGILPAEANAVLREIKGRLKLSLDEMLNVKSDSEFVSFTGQPGFTGFGFSFSQDSIIATLKYEAIQKAKAKIRLATDAFKNYNIRYADIKFDYTEDIGSIDPKVNEVKYAVTFDKSALSKGTGIEVNVRKCVYSAFIFKENTTERILPSEGAKYVTLYLDITNSGKKELRGLNPKWKLIDSKGYEHLPTREEKNIVSSKKPLQPESSVKTMVIFQMNEDCTAAELIGNNYPQPQIKCKIVQ